MLRKRCRICKMFLTSKYLNPIKHLVFKRIFGSEKNKDILTHFLNDILERPCPVKELIFLK
ncbi:hypothetical protein NEPTK9_000158 [Candidatus Neptunochlamydia vexilliferae]|uniref:Transposase n=1 Tax=Candidatus Neptunichlamydia vexilliferae TaxID=1651774 RepID=A0ABS0AX10_9BACT|nr:hypothetical protein [Candidatus Neptunochlamydia vexilliferae]